MAEETKIQWTDHTFNPWIGCAKVSPGCANCYAEVSTPSRAMGIKWGKGQPRQRTSAGNWREPIKWNRDTDSTDLHGRQRVFCASLADWLDDEVPIEWLADLLKLIHDTPNLDWLLLTKRPENFFARLKAAWNATVCEYDSFDRWITDWGKRGIAPANVWIGTTVEDQQRADERIPQLLKIPARVRFLSVEPLLGAVEFSDVSRRADAVQQLGKRALDEIDWVIVGGESGAKARPCNVDWIRSVVRQCQAAGVACFVKQLGANVPCAHCGKNAATCIGRYESMKQELPACDECCAHGNEDGCCVQLKHPKGGDPLEWPEDLRVREFPSVIA